MRCSTDQTSSIGQNKTQQNETAAGHRACWGVNLALSMLTCITFYAPCISQYPHPPHPGYYKRSRLKRNAVTLLTPVGLGSAALAATVAILRSGDLSFPQRIKGVFEKKSSPPNFFFFDSQKKISKHLILSSWAERTSKQTSQGTLPPTLPTKLSTFTR